VETNKNSKGSVNPLKAPNQAAAELPLELNKSINELELRRYPPLVAS
jgi:hypothetical protein